MIEYRYISQAPEARATEGENAKKQIRGIAALVGVETIIGDYFKEEIAAGAFDEVLADTDTRCLFNHDQNAVLGRTKSGSLKLSLDEKGNLVYENEISEKRQLALDVYDMIQSGDVSQSSFAFRVKEDKWIFGENGEMDKRIILKFSELPDVSPVTYPAYQATSVEAARSIHSEARSKANNSKSYKNNFYEYKLKSLQYEP